MKKIFGGIVIVIGILCLGWVAIQLFFLFIFMAGFGIGQGIDVPRLIFVMGLPLIIGIFMLYEGNKFISEESKTLTN
ncbi:MAG: hypothetical protein KBC17_00985 [Candidatus Pacebacteria bacterium]|nr:hypothetical protein [Candidatus Paceibacterota bacterium]